MPMKIPISLYHENVLATKNTFSFTSLVKTFQDNLSQEGAHAYILNDPSPSHLGIHDALIPIEVLNFEFVFLGVVKVVVVSLELDSP